MKSRLGLIATRLTRNLVATRFNQDSIFTRDGIESSNEIYDDMNSSNSVYSRNHLTRVARFTMILNLVTRFIRETIFIRDDMKSSN